MYVTEDSYYVVDHMVSDDCMAVRPGTECVTLLLKQLEEEQQEMGEQQMRPSGSGDKERKVGAGRYMGVSWECFAVQRCARLELRL